MATAQMTDDKAAKQKETALDTALTQIARTARRFDPEHYVEHLARHGFTHAEVNGLAFSAPFEPRRANRALWSRPGHRT